MKGENDIKGRRGVRDFFFFKAMWKGRSAKEGFTRGSEERQREGGKDEEGR